MVLLDGKKVSKEISNEIRLEIDNLKIKPRLDIIIVGEDYASTKYVAMKEKMAKKTGMESVIHRLSVDSTTEDLIAKVNELNNDNNVHGFMIQLPMPKQIDQQAVLDEIDYRKDVDGITVTNMGLIFQRRSFLVPATPLGVMKLLEAYDIDVEGKNVVILGRSNIVGTPLAGLLLEANATVTICHSRTENIEGISREAEILISATGKAHLVKESWVKEGSIVIDVGIEKDPESGNLVGDVDFDAVKEKVSYITPVPGGTGPMTIASLMLNTMKAYKNILENKRTYH
ncbi:MAG TPA: bifunctional 5,10-methylenetetrahydrofolate dehydrogenase/5,10-methenyltetrahydrofolate cyclohydrolase [bacterium]|nr:bifunctional 5,10-methylenetetrahydrofolate dehydrogenase/5,10-methenyltetrahydrofolate cyclohydrolase [bacterium]